MGPVAIGIDIGQKIDPTAVAVLEIEERTIAEEGTDGAPKTAQAPTRTEDFYIARHLERLALGTPYPAVAARLAELGANLDRRATQDAGQPARVRPAIYLDATGVGQPVVDLLKANGVRVTPIFFNHGDRLVRNEETGAISLGKALLVSQLQVLLQSRRILLPKTEEAEALARELQDYEIRVDEDANDKYGAFKVGAHDDLVTALGLAVVAGQRRRKIPHIDPGANKALARPSRWRDVGAGYDSAADSQARAERALAEATLAKQGRHFDPLARRSRWRL